MEGKLIKTEEGYYLVNNDEIKDDSYYLAWELNYRTPRWVRYVLHVGLNGVKQYNIVASNLDLEGVHKLSLENCQTIELGYDLEELCDEWIDINGYKWSNNDNTAGDNYGSFKAGFQKAIEHLGDKKFSEEDMIKMFFLGRESLDRALVSEQEAKSIVQSLPSNEWDVEIAWETDKPTPFKKRTVIRRFEDGSEGEWTCFWDKGWWGSGGVRCPNVVDWVRMPILDKNGCYILKRK